MSTFSGFKHALFFDTIFPANENIRSEGTLEAGIAKYFFAT